MCIPVLTGWILAKRSLLREKIITPRTSDPFSKKIASSSETGLSRLNFSRVTYFRQPRSRRYNSKMRATKSLPSNYNHQKTLDLSSYRVALLLNLAALPLLFIFGWLFRWLINFMRPFSPFSKGIFGFLTAFSGWGLVALPISIILMLVLHELIHGIFFWLFTHERPRFALTGGYAFAAAPDWFLPSSQYILVGISPLVIISVISILFAWFAASSFIPYLLLIATFNAAGALGDLLVVGWVFKQPKTILVKDEGAKFSSFSPGKD